MMELDGKSCFFIEKNEWQVSFFIEKNEKSLQFF